MREALPGASRMLPTEPDEWITTSTVLQRLTDYSDRDVWERFTERFHRPIQAFARKRGLPEQECEDVVQETLLAFAESYRAGRYQREQGRLSHWLFGIAWRRVEKARGIRERHVGESDVAVDALDLPAPSDVSTEWQEVWERSMLELCLRQARKEFQASTFRAFEMLVLEGRTVEDAWRELGTTANAVSIAKHRVGARMRELIGTCEDVLP